MTPEQNRELTAWRRRHRFSPNQLRHTAATKWRAEHGAEATLVLLGDRTTRLLDVYAEKNHGLATSIMEKNG